MSADQRHLWHAKPQLEEAAYGFTSQIMETEVFEPRAL
jgi:hypothetical protein